MVAKKTRTNRKKSIKNKTRKVTGDIQVKVLKPNFPIYASKKDYGATILEHTKEEEEKYKDSCLFGNMSWFGDFQQAKSYKQEGQQIYKWKINTNTRLLIPNKTNETFIKNLFQTTNLKLETAVTITPEKEEMAKKKLVNENIRCPYLYMSQNERAFFEFGFAYGYISAEEQYQFMKLIAFLIENKFLNIETREGSSILTKLKEKIRYYYFTNKFGKKQKYNRLSVYSFDKYALNNLCKIMPAKYRIDGVFQPNTRSFWFPDLVVYKMNIKEYVLYNPHHNLDYIGIVG